MKIDKINPQIVGGKELLKSRVVQELKNCGVSIEEIKAFIPFIDPKLLQAQCFYDKRTALWRYEYGDSWPISNKKLWGTNNIWHRVDVLVRVILCAKGILPSDKIKRYMHRIADRSRHLDCLSEMLPVMRLNKNTKVNSDVKSKGLVTDVDWEILPPNERPIFLEVKNRSRDLCDFAEKDFSGEPTHDHSLMFNKVEEKFNEADPNDCLQGVWICSQLRQNEQKLEEAFNQLNPAKIHFAIMGDFYEDVTILCRNGRSDAEYLKKILGISESQRAIF